MPSVEIDVDDVISINEAARESGFSRPTVSRAVHRGHLPAKRLRPNVVLISREVLAAWVEARHAAGSGPRPHGPDAKTRRPKGVDR